MPDIVGSTRQVYGKPWITRSRSAVAGREDADSNGCWRKIAQRPGCALARRGTLRCAHPDPDFNEGELVRRAHGIATGLDWPRDRLRAQVLDDSTNESAELAREAVAARQSRDGIANAGTRSGLNVPPASSAPPRNRSGRCWVSREDDPVLVFARRLKDGRACHRSRCELTALRHNGAS
jgi:hypothetical protein